MMKKLPQVFMGFVLAMSSAQAAAPGALPPSALPATGVTSGGLPQLNMSPSQALQVLFQTGYFAKPHYNGVPDPVATRNVMMRGRNRKQIAQKLRNIVIPRLDNVDNFNMTDIVQVLSSLIKANDPEGVGVNIIINPYLTPGSPDNQGAGAPPAGGEGGGEVGGGVDPTTGLPTGAGGGMGGAGSPTVDPTTGLPVGGGAGGAPAAGGAPGGGGLPGGGGGLPGGLPGGGGGLPGGGVIPGMGGGGAGGAITAAFMPERVQVRGLTGALLNLTAKQVLDIITMSFDHPIQYVILDQGVVFVQQPKENQGYFTRTFKLNPSAVLGFPMSGGGGGGGGSQTGGGSGGGAIDPLTGLPTGTGGGGGIDPSGGPGGPQMSVSPAQGQGQGLGQGFVPRGSQTGNRFNVQPFTQQNFGVNRSFQRFNSLTPGYGQSRVRGRQ